MLMSNTLNNAKILVTRPRQQAGKLCALIKENGGKAICFPTLQITSVDGESANKLLAILANIGRFQIGIFVSKHAVDWSLKLLGSRWQELEKLQLLAIGPATAACLIEKCSGRLSSVVYGKSGSESLLATDALQAANVAGKRVLIFRGQEGRELLADTLRKRGAKVKYAEVYQRIAPRYDKQIIHSIWSEHSPDLMVVTSCEALQNLVDLPDVNQRKILLSTCLVTISSRVTELARHLGFSEIITAAESSDIGILKAMLTEFTKANVDAG